MTGIDPGHLTQIADPITVRYVGLAVVGLLVVALLYMVIRYGDSDRPGAETDSGGAFVPGPAYGLTGTDDVEEVLMIDGERPRDDAENDRGEDRDSGGSPDEVRSAGRSPDEEDGDAGRFSHDVRERRDGEWLVEVSDGDRSARFQVSRTGSVLTVDPVASPGRRHGTNWVLAAERYLRDQEFGVETGTE